MPYGLQRTTLPCATRKQCISDEANKELFSFDESFERWEKSRRRKDSDDVKNHLLGLADPDSDCWRFFYKTLKRLTRVTRVTPDLPAIHKHYWDTLGKTAGRVLEAEWPDGDKSFSWTIFKPWVGKFAESEWIVRSSIIRAFMCVARRCPQWDDNFEIILDNYYAYCWATVSSLREQLPKHVDDAIGWLFEIWVRIAEKCCEERCKLLLRNRLPKRKFMRKRGEIEKTICKIIGAALPLLKMIDRTFVLNSVNVDDSWRHWREMLFDHTFSKENLVGAQRSLIVTKKTKRELEKFRDGFGEFLEEVTEPSNREQMKQCFDKCNDILNKFMGNL